MWGQSPGHIWPYAVGDQDRNHPGVRSDLQEQTVKRVAAHLARERKRQGLSQERLAVLAGLSRTGIRHFESGETSPTLLTFLRVSGALNVRLSELLESAE
jgi:ribosome-binding protein aMBF1 (putative translation factor)